MYDIDTLKEIENRWSGLVKEAGTIKDVTSTGKDIVNIAWNKIVTPMLLTVPAMAVLSGIAYSNLTSPKALAENADKLALQNALDTEIAVKTREIADLMHKQNIEKTKKYDRFV